MTYFPDVLPNLPDSITDTNETHKPSFAPRPSGLRAKLRHRLGKPLKIAVPHKGPVAIIQDACHVSYTLYKFAITD
jgi:hypothetical protein